MRHYLPFRRHPWVARCRVMIVAHPLCIGELLLYIRALKQSRESEMMSHRRHHQSTTSDLCYGDTIKRIHELE